MRAYTQPRTCPRRALTSVHQPVLNGRAARGPPTLTETKRSLCPSMMCVALRECSVACGPFLYWSRDGKATSSSCLSVRLFALRARVCGRVGRSFAMMEEQMVIKELVPLSCPLTMGFLKNPCRGQDCAHLTCFEFEVNNNLNACRIPSVGRTVVLNVDACFLASNCVARSVVALARSRSFVRSFVRSRTGGAFIYLSLIHI